MKSCNTQSTRSYFSLVCKYQIMEWHVLCSHQIDAGTWIEEERKNSRSFTQKGRLEVVQLFPHPTPWFMSPILIPAGLLFFPSAHTFHLLLSPKKTQRKKRMMMLMMLAFALFSFLGKPKIAEIKKSFSLTFLLLEMLLVQYLCVYGL